MLALIGTLVTACVGSAWAATRSSAAGRVTLLGIPERESSAATPPVSVRVGRTRFAAALGDPERLGRRLDLAGVGANREAILGGRALGLVGVGSVCLLAALAGPPLALGALPLLAACAIRGPEIVLARMGKRRQQRISARVPDLVELLVATTRAGLAPSVAFRRSADVLRGPLAEEVSRAVAEIDLGVPWSRALGSLVERTDVPPLRRLAVALGRSQRLGTSVGSTLRSVAEDLRADRRVRAEEAARRAPVKMLFPLVFLVLPAFLLLTVGPVVLATVRSLR
jgi:tight adherence protein C